MNNEFYRLIKTSREKAILIHKVFKKEIKKYAKQNKLRVEYELSFRHVPKHKFTTKVSLRDKWFRNKLSGMAWCHVSDKFDKLIGTVLAEYRLMKKIKNMKKNNMLE